MRRRRPDPQRAREAVLGGWTACFTARTPPRPCQACGVVTVRYEGGLTYLTESREDTAISCCNAATSPERENRERAATLVRAAILGSHDALGKLLEMCRPQVFRTVYRRLLPFRLESWAEDGTQDIFVDAVRSFAHYDPTLGNVFGWMQPLIKHACLDFINGDRVRSKEEPLPDNAQAEGDELQPDTLDRMSREAWETDTPGLPTLVPKNRTVPRRRGLGRSAAKELKQRRRERAEAEKSARRSSGKRTRNRRFNSPQKMTTSRRRREEWAEAAPLL